MYQSAKLLTKNNHKTIKGEKLGYITYILYLSPFTDNSKGINICPHASKGCSSACLFKSGFGGLYERVQQGRRDKTEWYLSNRESFMEKLVAEITSYEKKHAGKEILTVRLNGTSDIRFEKIPVKGAKNIFEKFPDIQFYDYTKNPKRFDIELPNNYHLTFSRSETNEATAIKLLQRGFNVAWVFNKLPETFEGFNVIAGDETDLRFLDKKGVIVGLTYKQNTGKGGKEANDFAKVSGFVSYI